MIKKIWIASTVVLTALRRHLQGRPAACDDGNRFAWRHDPLAHPALQSMDARALGDLPLPPATGDGAPSRSPAAHAARPAVRPCAADGR